MLRMNSEHRSLSSIPPRSSSFGVIAAATIWLRQCEKFSGNRTVQPVWEMTLLVLARADSGNAQLELVRTDILGSTQAAADQARSLAEPKYEGGCASRLRAFLARRQSSLTSNGRSRSGTLDCELDSRTSRRKHRKFTRNQAGSNVVVHLPLESDRLANALHESSQAAGNQQSSMTI